MKIKYFLGLFVLISFVVACGDNIGISIGDNSGSSNVLQGSYATIIPVDDYLYAVDKGELYTFKMIDKKAELVNQQDVGFNIENLHHNEGRLLIGSQEALYIYAIDNDGIPVRKSTTEYQQLDIFYPCDPVIAEGNYAYVTLSSGQGNCRNTRINELRIFDITTLTKPVLISQLSLNEPKGLGLKDDHLYICTRSGLQVVNIKDKKVPQIVNDVNDITGKDIIVNGDKLTIIDKTKLAQYKIESPKKITFLSNIFLD